MITKITSNPNGGVGFEINETLVFSMYWGPGSYTENHYMGTPFGPPEPEPGIGYSSKSVEVAIWYLDNPSQFYEFEIDASGNVVFKEAWMNDPMSYVPVNAAFEALHKLSETIKIKR